MTHVVCLGSAYYDQFFYVDAIPREPVKVIANSHFVSGGGMAATAAVAIAALGARSTFWGRLGADVAGAQVAAWLAEAGVNLAERPAGRSGQTPTSAVLVDAEGERLLAAFPGAGLADEPSWIPLETLDDADAVLCDLRWIAGAVAAVARARHVGIPSVLDADIAPPHAFAALIDRVDHVLFSERGLAGFTGIPEPRGALLAVAPQTTAQVGVTLGRDGCMLLRGGRIEHIPGCEVSVRDTSGAGDTFHGAYVLAIAEGADPVDAARFANAAAAVKCSLGRGWQGMPGRDPVHALMGRKDDAALAW